MKNWQGKNQGNTNRTDGKISGLLGMKLMEMMGTTNEKEEPNKKQSFI
ncbi:hypothetical protein [Flavobacterium sp.]